MPTTEPPIDLSRLCIHTVTTKPWPIEAAIERYASAGVRGISVWRDALKGRDIAASGNQIRAAGLELVSYVRGGFFPATSKEKRAQAIDENRRIIDEAESLGAPLIVLVCGADPRQSLQASITQIEEGISAIADHAAQAGVKLGIETLHPVYADTRSAINTLRQANDVVERIDRENVGVVLDVYHVWWDPDLSIEITRCIRNDALFAFHVCDWRVPTRDPLNDREIMGKGCIDIRSIRQQLDKEGFDGFIEVEIFSTAYWQMDQYDFLDEIIAAYKSAV